MSDTTQLLKPEMTGYSQDWRFSLDGLRRRLEREKCSQPPVYHAFALLTSPKPITRSTRLALGALRPEEIMYEAPDVSIDGGWILNFLYGPRQYLDEIEKLAMAATESLLQLPAGLLPSFKIPEDLSPLSTSPPFRGFLRWISAVYHLGLRRDIWQLGAQLSYSEHEISPETPPELAEWHPSFEVPQFKPSEIMTFSAAADNWLARWKTEYYKRKIPFPEVFWATLDTDLLSASGFLVNKLMKIGHREQVQTLTANLDPAAKPQMFSDHATVGEAVFRQTSKRRKVVFGADRDEFPDWIGCRYIHLLLAKPFENHFVCDMVRAVNPRPPAGRDSTQSALDEELSMGIPYHADNVLDDRAIHDYLHRIHELEDDICELKKLGSTEKLDELEEERHRIAQVLLQAHNPPKSRKKPTDTSRNPLGTPRKNLNLAETDRKSVFKAIKEARQRMEHTTPRFAAHLKRFIHTGHYCRYTPEPPVKWQL